MLPIVLAAALAAPAHALVLYKSVGANGVIEFSDMPPAGSAKVLEQRELTAQGSSVPVQSPAMRVASMDSVMTDDAVARATSQVDLAEHALALARRGVWSPVEGLRLKGPVRTASDEERIEYYKRGVLAARQMLMEVIKQRMSPPAMTTVASR